MNKSANATVTVAASDVKTRSSLVQKMKDDKNAITQFLKGEISGDVINERGIKFVKAV